ncbi:maltoporin [Photobacterium galatheae]|uniref:Maltoporin n=1 Tax=Photobacterium galatheae TaxID=1654360 RepID=A0A066RKE7_9GAMM|nr:maltoporin [Photobacterium galatheae]KDM90804.1 maltoporin [Photobacterium galatheae]MCM0149867.1 maltoporin [Photobacterium galatheae]
MNKICLTAAAVSATLMSAATYAEVDFHGYMRAGVGISGENGAPFAYEKNKVGRFGNENDVYGELGLGKEVYNENGKSFYVDSMLAVATDGSSDWESLGVNDDGSDNIALRQFNVQAKGFIPGDADATLWVGKRYYQRHDIHISDFYYWDLSGAGAGLENLGAGLGKLSFAVIRDDSDEVNVNHIDLRYSEIKLSRNLSLELGLNYALVNATDAQKATETFNDGAMLTGELTIGDFFGGFNKSTIQAGANGYGEQMAGLGAGHYFNASSNDDALGYRLINWGVIAPSASWEVGHQLIYAKTSFDNRDDHTIMSAVVRPEYKWSDNVKTIVEAGYYDEANYKNSDGSIIDKSGSKLTIAQAFTAGPGFWARPELRFYASYLSDYDNDNAFGTGNDTEYNIGAQVEAWW